MFKTIQYLISSKKLDDGFGIDNVAVVNGRRKIRRYQCISSSWSQWVKNNNRPNYSQQLKRVLA